ncbi:hypothetical protein DAT35_05515 [Vitiosangium sp. GDMCC 1.1324]|nr:hypothetical protein DAT35_05515 [Vitiosangium sp. GDMCC 1.1324]
MTVCNQGDVPGSTIVELVLSSDTSILSGWTLPGDVHLDSASTGTLLPQECQTIPFSLWAPSALAWGGWYLGGLADPSGQQLELLESNNGLAGDLVSVGRLADLVVQSVSGPASTRQDAPLEASVTVCNQGYLSSSPTRVELYLSQDEVIIPSGPSPGSDVFLGRVDVGYLNSDECTTLPVSSLFQPVGTWRLGAFVNPRGSVQESTWSNNGRAGNTVVVEP